MYPYVEIYQKPADVVDVTIVIVVMVRDALMVEIVCGMPGTAVVKMVNIYPGVQMLKPGMIMPEQMDGLFVTSQR